MRINWKYCLLVIVDICIFIYIGFAMVSWNKPDETKKLCTRVEINIEDENENGFLKTAEIKQLLESRSIYPLSKKVTDINTRHIEDVLLKTPFVKTAECWISTEGFVYISMTQRTPIMRVKADNGEDYYIDDNGGVMPNSQYTSDMIIVTGKVNRAFACKYLSLMAKEIMQNDLWRNQIEQINVLEDNTIEIIPRVGDHIINIGELPRSERTERRQELVTQYIDNQLHRIELFYRYGLKEAGWNKYSYISLEYANQVICTRRELDKHERPIPVAVKKQDSETTQDSPASAEEKKEQTDKKQEKKQESVTEKKQETTTEKKQEKKVQSSKSTVVSSKNTGTKTGNSTKNKKKQ